jgi:succinate dehydrogenase flavin-adding protein (antitoxin of CptAB toxin-antitoxin module)
LQKLNLELSQSNEEYEKQSLAQSDSISALEDQLRRQETEFKNLLHQRDAQLASLVEQNRKMMDDHLAQIEEVQKNQALYCFLLFSYTTSSPQGKM